MSELTLQTLDAHNYTGAENLLLNGFIWLERTIQVSIQLGGKDFSNLCRLTLEPLSKTPENLRAVKRIAEPNFLRDVRFTTLPYDEAAVKENIASYVDESIGQIYGCFFKENLAGFIEIVEADLTGTIRFAAVDEKFRMTGAAMSLYAGAVMKYQGAGFKNLTGRISSRNMPVMNLYAALGAKFSAPLDIYGKV